MDSTNDPGTPGPEVPTSEVHSQIRMNPSGADPQHGGIAEQAHDALDQARHTAQDARDRVGALAEQARGGAEELLGRAGRKLQRTGLVERIEQNPLAALGVAFGIGFLLAGSGRRKRGGTLSRATHQIKGAVVGGLTAALVEEAKSLLDSPDGPRGALGDVLNEVFGTPAAGSGERRQAGGAPTGPDGFTH